MSRSGYSDEWDEEDQWACIRWRGAVTSAIRGRRGQAFLSEMISAMEALPEHRLIADQLEADGAVCAIGAVGKSRAIAMSGIDPEDRDRVASIFNIAPSLSAEIVYMNDEAGWHNETPETRFQRMHKWARAQIRRPAPLGADPVT
jgi:hypothetical protein